MNRLLIPFTIVTVFVCSCSSHKIGSKEINALAPNDPVYRRFQAREQSYFMEVARDCASILKQHPVGDPALEVSSNSPGWYTLKAVTLPQTVTGLHPRTILLNTNHIWLLFGAPGQLEWGITWYQIDQAATNTWVLRSCIAYGYERTLYVASEP